MNLETIDIKLLKKIGHGSYADIYLTPEKKILKVVEPTPINKKLTIYADFEANILKKLSGECLKKKTTPCIIKYYNHSQNRILMEQANISLYKFVQKKKSVRVLKGIILQVLLTLSVLQKLYPLFRHNDLKIDNILLTKNVDGFTFKYLNKCFYFPSDIPLVKITDFDYANISKKYPNPKVLLPFSHKFGCTPKSNKIYDLHLFLNSLWGRSTLPKNVKEWIENIIPIKCLGKEETEYLSHQRLIYPEKWEKNCKIDIPQNLITDSWFNEFKCRKRKYSWGI